MLKASSLKCPNPKCSTPFRLFVAKGWSSPVRCLDGKRRQRLKCPGCGLRCTDNVHKIHYRLQHKDPALNSRVFDLCMLGVSNRKISRLLDISEHSVRIRLGRLSQKALEFHHNISADLRIREPVAYDGLENFAGSQYDPNNINQVVGRNSLFIYDFNFASMNRKGRTSPWQKRRLRHTVKTQGQYNPKNIRIATADILKRIYERRDETSPMHLLSDEHFQYRRVLKEDLKLTHLVHQTVSSKACRNYQNILFSVNHADLLIRQNIAAFARETISFSKTAGRMCQRYALFMVHKNYMCPQFTKKHSRREGANLKSPAERVGLVDRLLKFQDVFHHRSLSEHTQTMNDDWKSFWNAEVPRKYLRSLKFC